MFKYLIKSKEEKIHEGSYSRRLDKKLRNFLRIKGDKNFNCRKICGFTLSSEKREHMNETSQIGPSLISSKKTRQEVIILRTTRKAWKILKRSYVSVAKVSVPLGFLISLSQLQTSHKSKHHFDDVPMRLLYDEYAI